MFDYKKASKTQQILAKKLNLNWEGKKVNTIAGADCSYETKNKRVGASVVVCRFPELKVIDKSEAVTEVFVPYVPGFLTFREAPAFLKAFRKLKGKPDVTLVDGNGIAHPRKMGIASYIGVVLGIPTIGCTKSPFYPFQAPDPKRGAYTYYMNRARQSVGYCLRTQTGIKPIFVSPGHQINSEKSREIVLKCSKFRIPEPIRYAHKQATDIFRKGEM